MKRVKSFLIKDGSWAGTSNRFVRQILTAELTVRHAIHQNCILKVELCKFILTCTCLFTASPVLHSTKWDEKSANEDTSAQDRNNAPERSNNKENTDVIDQDTLNYVDQNSEADKTKRAEGRRSEKPDDWAPDSL